MNSISWAILTGFIVGSIAYYFNVDNRMIWGVPSVYVSWGLMAVGAFAGSFLLMTILRPKPVNAALFTFVGILFAVIAHIVYDLVIDSSSHNLFPLEIIFISFVTLPCTFSGAFLASLVLRKKE